MHLIDKLYEADYDFPIWEGGISKNCMLATTPRSGSTYLSIKLWQAGMLGAPMEYFFFNSMKNLIKRLGFGDYSNMNNEAILHYWERVTELRTSPNGVFSYKMFMPHLGLIIDKHKDLFKKIRPEYIIYLTRDDILGQAISHYRAIKSRAWFKDVPGENVEYNYAEIKSLMESITIQQKSWESIFTLLGVTPMRVNYEQFLQSEEKIIQDVFDFIGEKYVQTSRMSIPLIKAQADELSSEWRDRFLLEHEELR